MLLNINSQRLFMVAVAPESAGDVMSASDVIFTPADFSDPLTIFEPRPPWQKIGVGSDLVQRSGIYIGRDATWTNEVWSFLISDVDLGWLAQQHTFDPSVPTPDALSLALIQFDSEEQRVRVGIGQRVLVAGWQLVHGSGVAADRIELAFYVRGNSALQ